jgi:hypothetical protein
MLSISTTDLIYVSFDFYANDMELWNGGMMEYRRQTHYSVTPLFQYSDERELSSRPAFFSIREEEVAMAVGTKIDPRNLLFLNPFFLDLAEIDPGKIHHPLSCSS